MKPGCAGINRVLTSEFIKHEQVAICVGSRHKMQSTQYEADSQITNA